MKHLILGILLGLSALYPVDLGAQAPAQEVVLSARSGSKLGLALPSPQVTLISEAVVQKEFHTVLQRNLSQAGPFSLIDEPEKPLSGPTKTWADAGADWVVQCKVQRADRADEVLVLVQVADAKSNRSVFTKRYTGKETVLRRIAHSVSDDLTEHLTGEKGTASTRVVFVRQLTSLVKEIFQMDQDGQGLAQLTHHKSLTLSPTVSSDGRIAYISYKGGPPEIFGQRKPGGSMEKLYPNPGSPQGPCTAPAWSPDGTRLAFVQGDRRGNTDIVVLNLATNRVRRITDSNCINTEPTWNPKGTQIAFTSDRDGSPQVYLMEEDGSNVRRLTQEGGYNATPAWSPSGSMIAYVSRFEGKFDLFVYKLGEGKSYQVTTGVASSESPDWSPDERRIIFSSGSRGGMQLYTTDLSGNNLLRVTGFSGCQSPKWTRSR